MDYDRFYRLAVGSIVRLGVLFVAAIAVFRLNLSPLLGLGILVGLYIVLSVAQVALRRRRLAHESAEVTRRQ